MTTFLSRVEPDAGARPRPARAPHAGRHDLPRRPRAPGDEAAPRTGRDVHHGRPLRRPDVQGLTPDDRHQTRRRRPLAAIRRTPTNPAAVTASHGSGRGSRPGRRQPARRTTARATPPGRQEPPPRRQLVGTDHRRDPGGEQPVDVIDGRGRRRRTIPGRTGPSGHPTAAPVASLGGGDHRGGAVHAGVAPGRQPLEHERGRDTVPAADLDDVVRRPRRRRARRRRWRRRRTRAVSARCGRTCGPRRRTSSAARRRRSGRRRRARSSGGCR